MSAKSGEDQFETEGGVPETVEDVAFLERGTLQSEELGLTLAEAKALLRAMQQSMVSEQVEQYLQQFKHCADCGAARTRKGLHPIVYRTLFGKLNLTSPRLYDCRCQSHGRRSSSPLKQLLTTHGSAEFQYLQTKFASLLSHGMSVDVLGETLPIANDVNHMSMRRLLHRVAQRIEGELGDEQTQFIEGDSNDCAKLSRPGSPFR